MVKTSRCVVGDGNASKVLECIGFVASVYGENIILIQYLPSIVDMVGLNSLHHHKLSAVVTRCTVKTSYLSALWTWWV